jgi:P-type E1-E2 ATPase
MLRRLVAPTARSSSGTSLASSTTSLVVVIGLVPQGLLLAIVAAYALGAVRVAGQGALVQQTNAIESLSNVDTFCLDKTGTLTTNRLQVHDIHPFGISRDDFQRRRRPTRLAIALLVGVLLIALLPAPSQLFDLR